MFIRIAITKIIRGREDEFHAVQAQMHRILEGYGVEILGYYYCTENNTVYCPANWGSKERLMEIARDLQKDNKFMQLHDLAGEMSEDTELKEVINYPEQYTF